MKRELPSLQLAVALVLACITIRLLGDLFPEAMPNLSPLMALTFIGAMYFPRRWGWLIGPAAFILTDLAFLTVNNRVGGFMFSWWSLISLGIYLLAAGLGILISRRKSLGRIAAGSIACSLVFYVAANTFCWISSLAGPASSAYPATFAGWVQANTMGLPGYAPTWTFLRNGVAGDLLYVAVLLLILDRALLFGHASAKTATAPRAA